MNKPRLLLVISCYYPLIGGAEKQAKVLAESLINEGYEVSVLTKKRTKDQKEMECVNLVKIIRAKGVSGIFKKGFLLRNSYDVLIFAGQLSNVKKSIFFSQLLFALIAKYFFRKKIILWPTSSSSMYEYLLSFPLSAFFINSIDLLLCKSKEQEVFFKKIIWNKGKILAPPWSIIDTLEFSPPTIKEKILLRQRLGIPKDKKVLVFVGRLFSGKGIDLIITAYNRVYRCNSDVFLLVLGAVNENSYTGNVYYKKLVALGADRCKVVVNCERTPEYLKASDVFVFPSFSEGCSVSQLEAMSAGLICVGSDLPSIQEKIVDGDNGFIFKTGSLSGFILAINKALSLKSSTDMCRRSRATVVSVFEKSLVLRRWEKVLRYVLSSNKSEGVVIVTPWSAPRIGGIQKASLRVASFLAEKGKFVTILTRSHDPSLPREEYFEGVKIVRLSSDRLMSQVEIGLFLLKNFGNYTHVSVWGSYEGFLSTSMLCCLSVVRWLGKGVSIRLSNMLSKEVYEGAI